MARVLFVWELGGGLGHTMVHVGLAARLREAGHQVIFAIRDLGQAEEVIGRAGFHYLQAPLRLGPVRDPLPTSVSYPQILHNIGFSDYAGLLSQVKAWRLLFAIVQPAMVVFDHSPTALLAASDLAAQRIHIGTGFTVPPRLSPFPALAQAPRGPDPGAAEAAVLTTISRVRDGLGLPPLDDVAAMLECDGELLLTFPELDHYGRREDVPYRGDGPRDEGADPAWPPGDKRIFAYLKPFKSLGSLLESLAATGHGVLVYGPQIPTALARKHGGGSLRFCDGAVNLVRAGQECDLSILNGTHGTTAAMLLAGRPSLQLPLNLEQLITARRVQEMGAGLAAPLLKPEGMRAKLAALLDDPCYATAASRFAARHAAFDGAVRDRDMAAELAARLDS